MTNETKKREYIKTGITGFDKLFTHGIPKGSTVLIAGGTGSGKTNFCLQVLANLASQGKKCYFMGFEEPEQRLIDQMEDFGW
jgi:circadian clock protein KaiC